MFYTIYKITNKTNGKFYIGKHKTENLEDGYMGSGKLIRAAIKKYGSDNFQKEIVFVFDNEHDMNEAEKCLVVLSEQSYNLCPGGQGGFGYVNANELNNSNKNWDEIGRKISNKSKIQRKKEFEQRPEQEYRRMANLSQKGKEVIANLFPEGIWKGRTHSQETRNRMSEKAKTRVGSRNSQFGTCWVNDGRKAMKIRKEKLDEYLLIGYNAGRVTNRS